MVQIRIHTEQVRDVGRQFRDRSAQLNDIDNALQSAINNLDTWAWDGRSRADAEPMLDQVCPESGNLAEELERLGKMLQRVADCFENEDSTAAGVMEGMPWVEFDTQAGSVLGAETVAGMTAPTIFLASLPVTGDAMPDISRMSWDERFAHVGELQGQIQDLEHTQQELNTSIAATDQAIDDLDQQIAELQAQRDALQEEADDFWNKLKRDPEGWKWGFDDGIIDAPWRTKSDALEDEIAGLDGQIQTLQAQRDALQQERQTYQQQLDSVDQSLGTLQQQQSDLDQTIREGIPLDGPSAKHPYFPGTTTSNCTKYASEKRNVPCSGHAHQWDEQARAAGYEVGEVPVKGAVVVWERDAHYTQESNGYVVALEDYTDKGHVAIVQEVDLSNPDVIRIKIGHNTKPEEWITLDPAEVASGHISFIYDKLPEDTATV